MTKWGHNHLISNHPGSSRYIFPYMVKGFPNVALYGHRGSPLIRTGNIITVQGEGILCSYTDQISELFWQFTSSSDIITLLILMLKPMEL